MGFFSSLAWIIITFLFFTVMVAVISSLKTKEDNLDTAEGYFLASRSLPGVVIAGISWPAAVFPVLSSPVLCFSQTCPPSSWSV